MCFCYCFFQTEECSCMWLFRENWITQRPVMSHVWHKSSSALCKLITAGLRKNELGTHFSWIVSWKERCPLGESYSSLLRWMRNSDSWQDHPLTDCSLDLDGFRFPRKQLFCTQGQRYLGNIVHWLPLVFSAAVWQEGKEDGEVVILISEATGQIWWHLLLSCGGQSKENQSWEGFLSLTCLMYGIMTTMPLVSPTVCCR